MKSPPLPFTKICLSSYRWVSHSLQSLPNSWRSYMWTHAPRAHKQKVCVVVGIGIYVAITLDVERQAHGEGLKSFWVIMESSNKKTLSAEALELASLCRSVGSERSERKEGLQERKTDWGSGGWQGIKKSRWKRTSTLIKRWKMFLLENKRQ